MGPDKRRSERFKIEIKAETLPQGGSQSQATLSVTKNVSARGAYLVTKDPPEPGDILRISAGVALDLLVRVKRVEELDDGLYGFAVGFLDPSESQNSDATEAHIRQAWGFELRSLKEGAFSDRSSLRRVEEFVRKNYSKEIPLSTAAKVAALEATYFSALFHEKTGVTFSDWVQYVRVARALEMMSMGDFSVSEVAYAVGFDNLRTFERTFKKWTNMNPRTFKKLCRPDMG